MEKKKINLKSNMLTTVLLVLMALGAVSAVTMAWFSLSDSTRVYSMRMDATTGPSIRFDLDEHATFEQYVQTLAFSTIAERVQSVYGYNPLEMQLIPVTTNDGNTYTLEDGTVVSAKEGKYLRYTLHFMSKEDMKVHLTSASSREGANGTAVTSDNSGVVESIRIAFIVDGKTYVYDPSYGNGSYASGNMTVFGLPSGTAMEYNDANTLFKLIEGVDKVVDVVVWLEGTDPKCVNNIKGGDYSISLRFEGTDEENNLLH